MNKLFIDLNLEEKIQFFLKCQKLLLEFHPDSPFIFTQENAQERLIFAQELVNKYKGYCYQDENVAALFNVIKIEDPNNPAQSIKSNIFGPPNPEFNAVIVDFVVFRKMEDCVGLCRSQYSPRMEYIVFVKNNQPKIHKTAQFMAQILNLPRLI